MKNCLICWAGVGVLLLLSACEKAANKKPSALPNVSVSAQPLAIAQLNRSRLLRVYLPPSYHESSERYPVLYMHDGQNLFDNATAYAGEWGVDETLNQLAKQGLELIVVGIDNGGEHRMRELSPWTNPEFGEAEGEAYLRFIVETVKPMIDAHYRTRRDRLNTGIMGSSMGGLMSHHAALQYPDIFARAGVFSPSYWFAEEIFGQAKSTPLPDDARLYLLLGGREGDDMTRDFRRMEQLLEQQGQGLVESRFARFGKHHESFWRKEFPAAIRFLFGASAEAS